MIFNVWFITILFHTQERFNAVSKNEMSLLEWKTKRKINTKIRFLPFKKLLIFLGINYEKKKKEANLSKELTRVINKKKRPAKSLGTYLKN